MGDSHLAMGDREAAHEAFRRALQIRVELGLPDADAVRARLAGLAVASPHATGR